MTVREAASSYLRKGLAVIPIEPRSKRPLKELTAWQELRLTEDVLSSYFVDGRGIGVLTGAPSGGICDVDLDCPEALILGPQLLPKTDLWSGRDLRPRSHAWYRCEVIPRPAKFQDGNGECLVELRSDGQQTVVWPSVHPEGDRYRWWGSAQRQPAVVRPNDLVRAVQRLAAACVLARVWRQAAGSRHDVANSLAGALWRGGWTQDEAAAFIQAVAEAAEDEEARDRGQTARSTWSRAANGVVVTGVPSLAALLGAEVVQRITRWLSLNESNHKLHECTESIPTWPEALGTVALHGIAGEFVRLVEPHTESDPAAILIQFLVAFGNLIGRGAHFTVEADKHHTNLFVCLVGSSSKGRKGTSWGHVLKRLGALDEKWAGDRTRSGLSSGEGLIYAVRDQEIKEEPIRAGGKKNGDIVGYRSVVVDPGVKDKRLLVVEPEFASILRVMCRDGSTLSPTIRQAWDTGTLNTLTKNSPQVATGSHISIVAHVTADELRRYMDRTELGNGFANRILWMCVRRARVLPEGGRIDEADFVPFLERLRSSYDRALELRDVEIRPDEEARGLWREVYRELSEGKPGLLGAVTSRGEAQVMRLALLFALLDGVEQIRPPHLRAALEIWRYSDQSARFVFGDALGDPIADELLRALRKAGGEGMTRTQISEHLGRNQSAHQIARSLRLLSEQGLLKRDADTTGGRPAERWFAITGYERNERNEERVSPDQEELEGSGVNSFLSYQQKRPSGPAEADAVHGSGNGEAPGGPLYGLNPDEWEHLPSQEPGGHG